MRILVINTVPTDRNGITNVIFSYVGPILSESIVIDYVAINEAAENYHSVIQNQGGNFFVVKRDAKNILGYYKKLVSIMSTIRYDAVHIHGNSHTVILELLAAYRASCKVRIVHAHATSSKIPLIHHLLSPIFNRLCTDRFACGEKAGRWMFGKKQFRIIRNAIDTTQYAFNINNRDQVRSQLGWSDKIILIHVGDFSANKNQTFLVDLIKLLSEKSDNYRLLLIGDGDLKNNLAKRVHLEGLEDRVKFTGVIHDVYRYLCVADCVLMPSFHEGLPLSLIEQQANGLRCIVSNTVSVEANVTGNIIYLPLILDTWVNEIGRIRKDGIEEREKRSKDAIAVLEKAGYDIRSSALSLNKYYLTL